MGKLIITLKQHTPLIHFQGDQDGATIRATEFKPKLDKFLIEHAFSGGFEEYKQYLIGYKDLKTEEDFKDKKSFNYKLKFYNVVNLKKSDIKKDFPFYFNNIATNKFVYCDSLDLEIFSLNELFLEIILKSLPDFLMNHNFGQRQSKGFGSFFINDQNKYQINNNEKYYDKNYIKNLKSGFYIKLHNYQNKKEIQNQPLFYNEAREIFNNAEIIYTKIRRGGQKSDSYIKQYAENKHMIWDKDAIRHRFINKNDDLIDNAYLIKDLLGLSINELWKDNCNKEFFVKKEMCDCKNEDKIERMESPIFFKLLKDEKGAFNIYIKVKDIPKDFFDKKFKIIKYMKISGEKIDEFKLSTPKMEQFNIHDFFEFVKCKENIGTPSNKDKNNSIKLKLSSSIEDSMDPLTLQKLKSFKLDPL
ncbi:hypothetical protein [Clostridium algidicarnis]|uniref:Uncharacterized protein n=1 Tax=Clostridium algidicarnis TaxID=37659 RepID=A0ABS6C2C5_9CLOT|nr:hypothetical protein [Clostridium algidicarnis]MBU3219621.1 hypothetical protein [Clostridium algidicarnis]